MAAFTEIANAVSTVTAASTVNNQAFVLEPAVLPSLTSGTTALNGFPVAPGYQSNFINNPPAISKEALGQSISGNNPSAFTAATQTRGNNVSAFSTSVDTTNVRTMSKKRQAWSEMSKSDERLNIVRSRAARTLYETQGNTSAYTSDRGPITRMRLLKGPNYDPVADLRGSKNDVTQDIQELLSTTGFVNFFVTDLQSSFNEKTQVMTTFGDNEVVYYFGKQPIMLNISGLLFDSLENNWFAKFLTLYAGILRGTQLAKNFSLVELTFPNMVVTGSISGLSVNQNSNRDTDIPFNMQFIAKEVLPLPAELPSGRAQNLVGTLVDFRADRSGLQGYSLASGALGGGFMESTVKTVGQVSSALKGLSDTANNVNSTLNAFRTNIFSPVFGVLSTITKVVKSTTGSISSIISSFTNPVNQILRDITSIGSQAASIASLVENSINDVISVPNRTVTNVRNTIKSLKSSAGTITRVPENVSETFKRLYGSGRVRRGSAILSSGKNRKRSKAAILSSGAPYTPGTSNTL